LAHENTLSNLTADTASVYRWQ